MKKTLEMRGTVAGPQTGIEWKLNQSICTFWLSEFSYCTHPHRIDFIAAVCYIRIRLSQAHEKETRGKRLGSRPSSRRSLIL